MGCGTVVEACTATQDEAGDWLPGETQPRPEVVEIGRIRRAIAAIDVHFRSGISDAVHSIGGVGIEVLLPVEPLVTPSEDVPAQAGSDGQSLGGVVCILDERRIVRVRLGGEDVFGETGITALIAFPCRAAYPYR